MLPPLLFPWPRSGPLTFFIVESPLCPESIKKWKNKWFLPCIGGKARFELTNLSQSNKVFIWQINVRLRLEPECRSIQTTCSHISKSCQDPIRLFTVAVSKHLRRYKTVGRTEKAVMDSAVDTLAYSTRKHQDWFDSKDAEIKKLLNERNAAFTAKLRNPTSVDLQRRWALHRSQLQKRLRDMENTWWLSKATEIQNYADANMTH